MNGINNVTITGNITRDIAIHEFEYKNQEKVDPSKRKKGSVSRISVAINESTPAGKQSTTWVDVVAWSEFTDVVKELFVGDTIQVEGRLSSNSFTNKQGQKVWKLEVVASEIYLVKRANGTTPSQERKQLKTLANQLAIAQAS